MVKNLLVYGFENDEHPSVQSSLREISNAIKTFKESKQGFDQLSNDLKDIRDLVAKKEQSFYTKIGVSDFRGLNDKILELEQKYACLLPGGRVIDMIKNNFSFLKVSGATDQELADAVAEVINKYLFEESSNNEQLFNSMMAKAFDENEKDATSAILSFLQKNLTYSKGTKTKRFITSRAIDGGYKQRVGLGKIISSYNQKTNKVTASIEGIDGISSKFKKKLEEELLAIYLKDNKGKFDNKINVFDLSQKTYREYVNSFIHSCLGKTVDIESTQYDLNRSIASTLGYLGEVRATLILKELAPNATTRGTGNLRTAAKKQEIPIDIVCAANGFQIKNYTLDGNTVDFSNSMLVPNWISGRLKIEGELYDVLIALFGIYQYNQPITHGDPDNLEDYIKMYNSIDNEFFRMLKPIFDSRIPQMLKMADTFSVDGDPLFHSQRLYFNTFFWVNKYLVPASWILDQLINSLQKMDKDGGIINSSYSFNKQGKGSKDRFQVSGQRFRRTGDSPKNLYDMAKKVKVNYNISIDLTEFANLRS